MDPADEPRAGGGSRHPVRVVEGAERRGRRAPTPDGTPDEAFEAVAHRYPAGRGPACELRKDLGYDSADAARDGRADDDLGRELEGVAYDRLFDYYADADTWGTQNAWKILVDDYVTVSDGTGIVHQAPAYGEDDKRLADAAGLPTIISLDDGGRFLSAVTDVAGELWLDANRPLIRLLKQAGACCARPRTSTRNPHCWRCRNPLIYKAVSSWFVRVTDIKDDLLANNQRSPGCPRTSRRASSASGSRGRATGRSARNRYWARRSRCGRATTRTTRASTCTARSPRWRPTSAACR